MSDKGFTAEQRALIEAMISASSLQHAPATKALVAAFAAIDAQAKRIAAAEAQRDAHLLDVKHLQAERDALRAENERLQADVKHWHQARDRAHAGGDLLKIERDALRALVADLVGAMHSVAEFDWTSAAPILDRARAALAKGEK